MSSGKRGGLLAVLVMAVIGLDTDLYLAPGAT